MSGLCTGAEKTPGCRCPLADVRVGKRFKETATGFLSRCCPILLAYPEAVRLPADAILHDMPDTRGYRLPAPPLYHRHRLCYPLLTMLELTGAYLAFTAVLVVYGAQV